MTDKPQKNEPPKTYRQRLEGMYQTELAIVGVPWKLDTNPDPNNLQNVIAALSSAADGVNWKTKVIYAPAEVPIAKAVHVVREHINRTVAGLLSRQIIVPQQIIKGAGKQTLTPRDPIVRKINGQ